MLYFLHIKGNETAVLGARDRYLPKEYRHKCIRINRRPEFDTTHIVMDIDDTKEEWMDFYLNQWFCATNMIEAPYPAGTLLFWTKEIDISGVVR